VKSDTQTKKLSRPDEGLIDQLNKLAEHILKMDSGSGDARLIEMASVRIRELNKELYSLQRQTIHPWDVSSQ